MPVYLARSSRGTTGHSHYEVVHNGTRSLRTCTSCGALFSETTGTPMQGIKTPISKVAAALRVAWRRAGLRATARIWERTRTRLPSGNAGLAG